MTRAIAAIIALAYGGPNFSSGPTAGAKAPAYVQTRDTAPVAQAAAGTASISGIVLSADTGAKPIRLAHVVLIGAFTGTLKVTSTDRDGRFAFDGLPADRFVIGASKPPYLGAVAGARRPARPGTPIVVAAGQKVANVAIRMPMGAAIAGVITDERGQPAPNTAVVARQLRLQNGERVLVAPPGAAASTVTDERGRYRMYGLVPGEYVISAIRIGGVSPMARTLTDADVDRGLQGTRAAAMPLEPLAPAPVFFPGTTRQSDATPIALTVGEERQGVDFRLEFARSARVGGTITTSDGQPPNGASLLMTTAAASLLQQSMMAAASPRDGRFMMPSVAPGTYTLVARMGTPPGGPGGPQGGQFATTTIDIAGVDQLDIQLTLRPALTLSGRLAFDGTAPPPALVGRRIPLRSLTPGLAGAAAPQVMPTNATGAFTVTGLLPGRYVLGGPLFFGATADSVTWALQSVVVDGRDVTDLPIDITPDTVPKDVVVTFGERVQEISGRLQQSSGAAATDYTIIVFPADKAYWIPGSRRILTTRPGTDGQFRLGGTGPTSLPPGAYLVAAVTDIDRDEQFDPALLESLIAAAVPVTLAPGDRKVQDLVIR